MVSCDRLSEWDTRWWQAYALLYDSVNKEDLTVRIGAIMGLGLAYAGSQKEEVRNFVQLLFCFSRIICTKVILVHGSELS